VAEILRTTLGRPIERPHLRSTTHKGFDFRWLRAQLGRHFVIQHETLSPFPSWAWFLNSQIFFVCEPQPSSVTARAALSERSI
jgi:hypothetical protein